MYASSFRRKPESSIPARIAEEDKHRVKDKGYLLPKQSHSTAEDAEVAEKANNRVKDKTIIRRPFVASGLAPDVKDVSIVIPADPGSSPGPGPESSVAARIAEEDKHRVKDKGYLLPKQSHSTAEVAEKTNNRVKDKTIIRRSFVASGLAPDVKNSVAHEVRRNTSFW